MGAMRDGQRSEPLIPPGPGSSFDYDADCLSTDLVGMFVIPSGPRVAGMRQVTVADISDTDKTPAVGVIVSKSTATRCRVRTLGGVVFAGLTPGKTYWVDTTGYPVHPMPTPAPGSSLMMQPGGVALDEVTLFVNPGLVRTLRHG
jgi:hypothetical protein